MVRVDEKAMVRVDEKANFLSLRSSVASFKS